MMKSKEEIQRERDELNRAIEEDVINLRLALKEKFEARRREINREVNQNMQTVNNAIARRTQASPDEIAERQREKVVDFLDRAVPLLFIVLGLALLLFLLVSLPLVVILIASVIVSCLTNIMIFTVIMNRL